MNKGAPSFREKPLSLDQNSVLSFDSSLEVPGADWSEVAHCSESDGGHETHGDDGGDGDAHKRHSQLPRFLFPERASNLESGHCWPEQKEYSIP